jgi:hypothetical protein
LPKGAWYVTAGPNQVVLYQPTVTWSNISQAPGSGLPPGMPDPTPSPGWAWSNTLLPWRAGIQPPNFYGWFPGTGKVSTLVWPGATGIVLADGQNVAILGGGCSTIMQAYSV